MRAQTLLDDRHDPDCLLARARQSLQDVDRPTVVGEVTAVRQRQEPEPLRRGSVAQSFTSEPASMHPRDGTPLARRPKGANQAVRSEPGTTALRS